MIGNGRPSPLFMGGGAWAWITGFGLLSKGPAGCLLYTSFLNNPLTPAAAMAAATISLPFNALKSVILSVILAPLLPLALPPVRRALGRLS